MVAEERFHPWARPLRSFLEDFRPPWGPYDQPSTGRDLRIDFLRGFCVFAMVVDHIAGSSFLYGVTGGNRFYTSAAEAFIFISGLVMGLVYRRFVERDGIGLALRRGLERAVTLYLVTITLSLIFIPASEMLNVHWAQGIDFSDPAAFVVAVLTLHQTYYLVDIPLLYTILIFVAPLAFLMLSQQRTGLVLGASWGLWAAYQFFPEQAEIPWPISGNYLFYASAWQIFFFTGLVLGWHDAALTKRLQRVPRRRLLVLLGGAFAGLVWLYHMAAGGAFSEDVQLLLVELVFGKADVRPGRILASIVVFGFFYLLATEAWKPLSRAVGPLLLPLGQSPLYAYAAHAMIAIPVGVGLGLLSIPDRMVRPMNALVQICVLALILLLIRQRFLFVDPNAGRARYAWPLGATVGALVVLTFDPSPTLPGLAVERPQVDPYGARIARAFGTPVPGRPAPAEGPAVQLPRPSLRQITPFLLGRGEAPASLYVGAIRGTFRSIGLYSPALEREMPYFVYLPPDYDRDTRRYPVLFMLHGNSGSNEEWAAYGLIDRADRMIVRREILPMIIVLPQGDFSYWVNHADGGPRYGDYVSIDLVRHIGATFRALPGPEHQAIGGLSMGGTGALVNAFRNPDVFGVVGAHSPSLPEDDGSREFLGRGNAFGARDAITLAGRRQGLENLTIWIDIGDEDPWLDRTEELRAALDQRSLDYEWRVFPGEHWGGYWSAHLSEYLRFYDGALNPGRR